MQPMVIESHFTHQVWGGERLKNDWGKAASGVTGESWEASALMEGPCYIQNGEWKGRTLLEAIEGMGRDLLGEAKAFSVLVKLIDAQDRLSVQVHPNDEYAKLRHGEPFGKTEAWVVLEAPPGAELVYGINVSKEELNKLLNAGGTEVESALRKLSVKPGDALYIPAGTVHAIGAGILVYEIQQSSNRTYRLYDWGRDREVHVEDALNVLDEASGVGGVIRAAPVKVIGGLREVLTVDSNFGLERLTVSGEMPITLNRFHIITALGELRIGYAGEELSLSKGQTAVIPAALGTYTLIGSGSALLGYAA